MDYIECLVYDSKQPLDVVLNDNELCITLLMELLVQSHLGVELYIGFVLLSSIMLNMDFFLSR